MLLTQISYLSKLCLHDLNIITKRLSKEIKKIVYYKIILCNKIIKVA